MQEEPAQNAATNNSGYEPALGLNDQQKNCITSALNQLAEERVLQKGTKNAVSHNMRLAIERLAFSNQFFKDVHQNPPHSRSKLYRDVANQVSWFTQHLNDYGKNR